jgi:amino-acid N-acetyltransferase
MESKRPQPAHEWTLRDARADDLEAVRDLLAACNLPADDLAAHFGNRYVVAEKDADVVGVAGVEVHGRHALLRSVAVAPSERKAGLGAWLVRERVDWTQAHGIKSLYLLTMDAESYFTKHGFITVTRDTAPPEIQATSQFADLCPSTATLMHFIGTGDPETLRDHVRDYYGRAAKDAKSGKNACCGGSCGADNAITSDLYDPK